MIKQAIGWTLGGLCGLVVAGCGKGGAAADPKLTKTDLAPIKPGEEASLMPLAKGNQWTYTVEDTVATQGKQGSGTGLYVYRVVDVKKTAEGTEATMELEVKGKVSSRQKFLVKADGLYETAAGMDLKAITPPQPVILFPPTPGRTFNWSGAGVINAKPATQKVDYTTRAPQEVDTDAGPFAAICIDEAASVSDGKLTYTSNTQSWYAPTSDL